MNSDGASAGFRAIDNEIVGFGTAGARLVGQKVEVLISGGSEGMVHSCPATFLFVVLEHGKLDDPGEVHIGWIVELQLKGKALAQPIQGLASDVELIGDYQQQVARLP